jgi:hypothetical protein
MRPAIYRVKKGGKAIEWAPREGESFADGKLRAGLRGILEMELEYVKGSARRKRIVAIQAEAGTCELEWLAEQVKSIMADRSGTALHHGTATR